ncbi:alpha/beta hydrolase family protein [Zunongwangia sp. HRR-M8]|uniref:alpha/beta hydrolase family protein n=1 Tax=Zunongwangia sp. HRR-M8 TaxID=3015170 RepID=UPI0022DE7633|nr:hypothetical protein [Zunongwangia sp. HRR-M8]WBL22759.1 hypothetical protein PBT89_02080 [Zunongwangia sp. HRR-M8]
MKTISILSIAFCCLFTIQTNAQWLKTKTIDEGGSGPYHAIAVSEKSLSDFVIYRPENIEEAVSTEDKLPILIWANGGCMDSSIHHERLLSEIASYGYVIVAIGDLQMTIEERTHKSTEDEKLLKGLDWITKKANTKGNDYYNNVDLNKIAAGGQSCGGAQVMRIAGNPAIKTYMMFNSGMGDMTMAGASTKSLQKLNADVIYLVGGETDVATENAFLDYDRIENVPVAFGNNLEAGHGGTFNEKNGGSFAKMAKDWLDWHFKNKDKSDIFLESNLENYPGWTMKSKNFDE